MRTLARFKRESKGHEHEMNTTEKKLDCKYVRMYVRQFDVHLHVCLHACAICSCQPPHYMNVHACKYPLGVYKPLVSCVSST